MDKWRYLFVTFHVFTGKIKSMEPNDHTVSFDENTIFPDFANMMGDQGWELLSITPVDYGIEGSPRVFHMAVFKMRSTVPQIPKGEQNE